MKIRILRFVEDEGAWSFMEPVDPYWADSMDLIIWTAYTNFAEPLNLATFKTNCGLGACSLDHEALTHVTTSLLGHSTCPWYNGFVSASYTRVRNHIRQNWPTMPHE